jgi:hypothetical protein
MGSCEGEKVGSRKSECGRRKEKAARKEQRAWGREWKSECGMRKIKKMGRRKGGRKNGSIADFGLNNWNRSNFIKPIELID